MLRFLQPDRDPAERRPVPAIDEAVPEHLETATFANG